MEEELGNDEPQTGTGMEADHTLPRNQYTSDARARRASLGQPQELAKQHRRHAR
jgi:hypothetical protein